MGKGLICTIKACFTKKMRSRTERRQKKRNYRTADTENRHWYHKRAWSDDWEWWRHSCRGRRRRWRWRLRQEAWRARAWRGRSFRVVPLRHWAKKKKKESAWIWSVVLGAFLGWKALMMVGVGWICLEEKADDRGQSESFACVSVYKNK